jgi:hypothetical protein
MKAKGVPRVGVMLAAVFATLALSAVMASSASAFSWWIGTQSEPKELTTGTKLALGTESKVKKPFSLKWGKGYEVKCASVKYAGLYIEGPVFLGARKISFEECTVKKPKGAAVAAGEIDTGKLVGEITPDGSKVAFELKPVGPLFASFTLEQVISPKVKHKHKRKPAHFRRCKTEVSISGQASGTLGGATVISDEKSFEFNSSGLEVSQVKSCHRVSAADAALRADSVTRSSDAKPAVTEEELKEEEEIKKEEAQELKEQEEEEAQELKEEEEEAEAAELEEKEQEALEAKREKVLEEAEACKENGGSGSECKTLEKEAKEIEEVEAERKAEKIKEAEEIREEQAKRAEEEAIKPIEGNKGNNSYNGGFGWGV